MALLLMVGAVPIWLLTQGSSPPRHSETNTGATAPTSARWNSLARGLEGGGHGHGHGGVGLPTRPLAVLSVAQWAAAEGSSVGPDAALALAVGAASAEVLNHLYPGRAAQITEVLEVERRLARERGLDVRTQQQAETVGRSAAASVIARAKHGELDQKAELLSSGGGWSSAAGKAPVGAAWGNVRPWVLSSASAVRPVAPPDRGSKQFEAELEEVRRATSSRDQSQLQSAIKWAEASMPGHWNTTAARLIAEQRSDERQAARILAVLNTALMDAQIACFEAKYTYSYIRPSQADPTISVPVALPNFPAYPSGHACISGAAAKVLSHYFPASGGALNAEAEEVAVSRLYAGVHYPIDNKTGLEMGRRVAELVLAEVERTGIKAVTQSRRDAGRGKALP